MDFGQVRHQQHQNARLMMYQNTNYNFERNKRKTLIVDVSDLNSVGSNPLTTASEFTINLYEPLIIDSHSEIYLDSFLTHNCLLCDNGDRMAACLTIKEFNLQTNIASNTGNNGAAGFNSIIIPNEHNNINDAHSCVIHKGKKMNYVCDINPCRLTKIEGKITDMGGSSIFSNQIDGSSGDHYLYRIKLTTNTTSFVPSGTIFGFNGGVSNTGGSTTTGFIVAYDIQNGADTIFFFSNGGTLNGTYPEYSGVGNFNDSSRTINTVSTTTGIDTLSTDKDTFKASDDARFIAEFVIISKD